MERKIILEIFCKLGISQKLMSLRWDQLFNLDQFWLENNLNQFWLENIVQEFYVNIPTGIRDLGP